MENNSNVRRFTGTAVMVLVAVVAFFMSIGLSVQVAQAGPAMSHQVQAQNAALESSSQEQAQNAALESSRQEQARNAALESSRQEQARNAALESSRQGQAQNAALESSSQEQAQNAAQARTQVQPQLYLWPIAGAKTGDNILFRPQQYIDGNLNFGNLIIGAPEGTPVVAPVDGVIYRPGVAVKWGTGMQTEQIASVVAEGGYGVPDRCVSMTLGIRTADGDKLWFSGLNGDMVLKDGQKIRKGDTLGYVAYYEPSVDEPHICFSMSGKNNAGKDPMTPFGLETTFIEPEALVIPDSLTAEQAQEDFRALMDVLYNEYPSLYDVVTPQEIARYDSLTVHRDLAKGLTYTGFWLIVKRTVALVHDSHIGLMTDLDTRELNVANIFPGVMGDSLIVTRVMDGKGLEKYVGRRIAAIDGRPAEDIIDDVRAFKVDGYDGRSESLRDYKMSLGWNWYYDDRDIYSLNGKKEAVIEFADGEVYRDRWVSPYSATGFWPQPSLEMARYNHLIRYKDCPYSFRMLNDSTVYFGLSSFDISKVDRDAVRDSIAAHLDVPYMVMDLRDNPGGDVFFTNELLSMFINAPTRDLGGYSWVKTRGPLRHSLNYGPDQIVFPDYEPVEGKEGYFAPSENSRVLYPDSTVNYRGRLYILTDETSCSAASLFPSVLVRNRRAVTVGRETQTCYHFMTALKYNEVRLPNSKIVLHIPLVREVFDTTVTPRTPAGRGLMPDYPVPATYEEYFTAKEDFVLDRALELIAEGKYLGEDYFAEVDAAADKKDRPVPWLVLGIAAVVAVAAGIAVAVRRRR